MPEAMARVKREKPIAMCMLVGVEKVEAAVLHKNSNRSAAYISTGLPRSLLLLCPTQAKQASKRQGNARWRMWSPYFLMFYYDNRHG